MFTTVPLSKLRLSGANVRKTGPRSIEQLAATIEAHGVLQNLVVTPLKKPRGHFEVFAGGRRFQALTLLAEQGKIDKDFPVPAREKTATDAEKTELSLVENFERMAMTPADECRAFQDFIAKGDDLDAVATRFGVTRRFVEGRLRLANLADPIFAALREGTLTLDKAKAFASTDNIEKQLRVFETYGTQGYYSADTIKRAIQHETMRATDAIALLVGEEAYVAAGGHVTRDLYETDGDRWTNPEIAERLAAEKMTAEATRIGAETGLAWIRPIATTNTYNEAASLYRVSVPQRDPTEAESAAMAAIEARLDEIETAMDEDGQDDGHYEALEAECEALRLRYQTLDDRPAALDDALKSKIGAFLLLTPSGALVLDTSYYSEAPIGEPGETGPVTTAGGRIKSPPAVDATVPGGKPLSAKLSDSLAVQRRDVLAAAILAQPALALDYALFAIVDPRHAAYGSTIARRRPDDPVPARDVPPSRARDYLGEVQSELDSGWTEHAREVDRFDAFRALDDDAKAAWLAMAVATSLEAKCSFGHRTNPLQARLAELLEIDVAAWWRPTSENFFDKVSKSTLLAILADVGGPALAGRYMQSKKGEISGSCQTLFAGHAVSEPEIRETALAWLPRAMQFGTGSGAPIVEGVDDAAKDTVERGGSVDGSGIDDAGDGGGEAIDEGDAVVADDAEAGDVSVAEDIVAA
ncbi:ParB/RepB/Spo0J family partition protein [Sphingomonas sp. SUN039]|uniref:ParB/RepB/Spo0J family partition protein n=1 Tax=Sphingomonas sp. SUN039 TaxID=2937787 RepID=UPI002164DCFF|nr:ParB/RepB/Spo0J family partition protein [Sphingomonas sp. SUN039]UVO53734.1 ParB/RepB/Spo0J family partition protein [Sphingomonas sp. SUN039]